LLKYNIENVECRYKSANQKKKDKILIN